MSWAPPVVLREGLSTLWKASKKGREGDTTCSGVFYTCLLEIHKYNRNFSQPCWYRDLSDNVVYFLFWGADQSEVIPAWSIYMSMHSHEFYISECSDSLMSACEEYIRFKYEGKQCMTAGKNHLKQIRDKLRKSLTFLRMFFGSLSQPLMA